MPRHHNVESSGAWAGLTDPIQKGLAQSQCPGVGISVWVKTQAEMPKCVILYEYVFGLYWKDILQKLSSRLYFKE